MGSIRIDNRRDILLLLLYSPGVQNEINESIVGRTRLVKMLFLFKTEALQHFRAGTAISEENFYEFFAWNFGPFSSQVYDDLMFFTLRGFIDAEDTTEDPLPESAAEWHQWLTSSPHDEVADSFVAYDEQQFRLTDKGKAFTSQLFDALSHAQKKLLHQFKKRLNGTPLRAILRYVYEKYPEQIERSQITEDVLGHRGH